MKKKKTPRIRSRTHGLTLRGIRREFDAAIEKASRMRYFTNLKDLVGSGYAWHHPNDIDWGMTGHEARAAYQDLERRFDAVYYAYKEAGMAFHWTEREWGTLNNDPLYPPDMQEAELPQMAPVADPGMQGPGI